MHPITQLPHSSCCPEPQNGSLELAFGKIHSFHNEFLHLFVWPLLPTCMQIHLYQSSQRAIRGPIIYQLHVLSGPHFAHL